jgi:hypothetical protein
MMAWSSLSPFSGKPLQGFDELRGASAKSVQAHQ